MEPSPDNPLPELPKPTTGVVRSVPLRIGQFYLDLGRQRLFLLNPAAKFLRSEGIPIRGADLAKHPLLARDGQPVAEEQLPLMAALRERRAVEETFLWQQEGKPPMCVTWSATPHRNPAGEMVGVFASLCCTPPPPDWKGLAGLAHDLRTPLAALQMLSSLLAPGSGLPETDLQANLKDLRSAVDRALQVGMDLLEWCRAPAHGGREVKTSWLALEAFLAGLVREQNPAATRKGLTCASELSAVHGWEMRTDPVRLGRLLSNLLVNAIRYTQRGGVKFTAAWREDSAAKALVLSIVDTGAGIASEEQESIFLPFERGQASKDDDSGGSGLGLAVVDRLVEELGLELEVFSQYGRGSEFHLVIPGRLLRLAAEAPPKPGP
jgi:Histidine kinase-, DNA gyrase B-, and HSP90-like ATPase/His Kinase A (phospho-acceptor) domain